MPQPNATEERAARPSSGPRAASRGGAGDSDRARIQAAVRAAHALARVVGMRLIYERENEILEGATAQLVETVEDHVARHGPVRWRIEPKMIRPEGEGVSADTGAETPIAGRLYREGVRALVLEAGIDAVELVGLTEVLASALRYGGQADDLVTVLWKRDFRHIDYFLLDHADLVDFDPHQETAEVAIGGRDLVRQVFAEVWRMVSLPEWDTRRVGHIMDVDSRSYPQEAPTPEEAAAGGVTAKSESERFLDTASAPVGDLYQERDVGRLFGIGAAEVERIDKEIHELAFLRSLARASDLALDLIRAGRISVSPQSLAALYVDAIREHACRGQLEHAVALLTRLSELAGDASTPLKARASLAEVQSCLARPERLEPFCDLLVRQPATTTRVVLAYLELLGGAGLAGAEHVLSVVETSQVRARLVRFLADRALDGRFPLDEVLKSAHGEVVEVVLERIRERDGNSLEYLEPLFGHPSATVRKYLAQCVASIKNERSATLCERLLDDEAPDVRLVALATLAALENKATYRRVLPRVTSLALNKLPAEEQTALFRVLMASDPSRAVRVLEALALRRGWPWNRTHLRVRELAACALASAGTHRVRAFLKRGASSSDLGLRQACERARAFVPSCTIPGRLGDALVKDGGLSDDGLSEALHHQKRFGGRIGEIVVQNGLADERAVLRVMAQRLGLIGCLTAEDLDNAVIESAAFHLVPVEVAKRHRVIPVHYAEGKDQLYVATANPGDATRLDALRKDIHAREVVVLIALKPTIDAAMLQFYGGKWESLRAAAKAWVRLRRASRRGGPGLLTRLGFGRRPPVAGLAGRARS